MIFCRYWQRRILEGGSRKEIVSCSFGWEGAISGIQASRQGRVGNSEVQIFKRDGNGMKELKALPGIHGYKKGYESLKIFSVYLGEVFYYDM